MTRRKRPQRDLLCESVQRSADRILELPWRTIVFGVKNETFVYFEGLPRPKLRKK